MSEVPQSRRLAQCICAVIWCLLSGGPIFGFAALKPILINEHVYEDACDVSSNLWTTQVASVLSKPAGLFISSDSTAKCTNQDLKLNMIFTVGAMLTNVSALVIGRVLDVYGPKVCGLLGAFFLYLASLVFIFAQAIASSSFLDPYLLGYAFLALGGPFAFISSFQLSNSFPKKSGIILAIITGAFDASSAVFLVYRIFYNRSHGAFTIAKFFKLYMVVPLFITLAQVTIMPSESYKATAEHINVTVPDETSPLLDSNDVAPETPPLGRRDSIGDALRQPYEEEGQEHLEKHAGGIFGVLHGHSAKYQVSTPWFYLMGMFTTISMLRLNYFVATIGSQYTYMIGPEGGETLNKFFDIALPLGGLISVPFVGVFLDNCSSVFVLTTTLAISLTIGIFGLVNNYIAGVVNVCLFVVFRPLFYTVVSDYCAMVFGFDTFGTVYGTIISISGAFNYGQSILDKLTHTTFHMNPLPINLILLASTVVIGIATVTYVRVQARVFNSSKKVVTR